MTDLDRLDHLCCFLDPSFPCFTIGQQGASNIIYRTKAQQPPSNRSGRSGRFAGHCHSHPKKTQKKNNQTRLARDRVGEREGESEREIEREGAQDNGMSDNPYNPGKKRRHRHADLISILSILVLAFCSDRAMLPPRDRSSAQPGNPLSLPHVAILPWLQAQIDY